MLQIKKPIGTIGLMMGGVAAVQTEFAWSLSQMIQYNNEYLCRPGEYIHLLKSPCSYHPIARNHMVAHMQGDWLFQLDSDHVFEPDLLARMLRLFEGDEPKIDVLTGVYQYRAWPYNPVLYAWKDGKFRHVGAFADKTAPLAGGVGFAGGAGCLLVRRSVFERIRTAFPEQGPFDIIPPYSEDNSFFIRLMKLEIPVYVAPQIECHHLISKALSLDDFDKTYARYERD